MLNKYMNKYKVGDTFFNEDGVVVEITSVHYVEDENYFYYLYAPVKDHCVRCIVKESDIDANWKHMNNSEDKALSLDKGDIVKTKTFGYVIIKNTKCNRITYTKLDYDGQVHIDFLDWFLENEFIERIAVACNCEFNNHIEDKNEEVTHDYRIVENNYHYAERENWIAIPIEEDTTLSKLRKVTEKCKVYTGSYTAGILTDVTPTKAQKVLEEMMLTADEGIEFSLERLDQ